MLGIPSPEIVSRDEFALLCNWRKLGRAVEVGVDRGEFAERFLNAWNGHNWMGVDSYAPYPEFPWDREADYLFAAHRIERTRKNCKLVRGNSVEVAAKLAEYSGGYFADVHKIDFVYIDGDHTLEAVARDIETWWPLVSDIGILAGHDYDAHHAGVIEAVDSFAAEHGLAVYITADSPASWYVYKLGLPGPEWRRVP